MHASSCYQARYGGLLASLRRPSNSILLWSDTNVLSHHTRKYSSIAQAMLGRAVHKFQPPLPSEKEKAIAPPLRKSSSSANNVGIDDLLKAKAHSQKSIGAFTQGSNKSSYALSTLPPVQTRSKPSSLPLSQPPLYGSNKSSSINTIGKPLVTKTDGFAATLQRAGSFQENTRVQEIDLTMDDLPLTTQAGQFDFNPDDFEDDDALDLDMEYDEPIALPTTNASRAALDTLSQNLPSMPPPPSLTRPDRSTVSPLPISSNAIPWSSSPERTRTAKPVLFTRRVPPPEPKLAAPEPSSDDIQPMPKRRRTVPWSKKPEAAKDESVELESESKTKQDLSQSSPTNETCFKCGSSDHWAKDCRNRAVVCSRCQVRGHHASKCTKTSASSKISGFMFNTTAGEVKEREKQLRERNKLAKSESVGTDLGHGQMRKVIAQDSKKLRATALHLSQEQKKVLSLVCEKNASVFFTGSAGTGKSVLMRAIIADLKRRYSKEPDRVAVTASTGLAACNIGGVTLHSFSGIGLGKESAPDLVKKITKNQKAKTRWLRTRVLIIDEISMVDGDLFDKLEEIARRIRKNGRPFGGIKLVITGDFFQLPPVPDSGRQAKFAFDAATWDTSIDHTIGLTEVFRQRDPEFANMLNEMRLGKLTDQSVKRFRALDRPLEDALIDATELFPTRREVDNANESKMKHLKGVEYNFPATDTGTIADVQQRERLLQNVMAPPILKLKKGAQVMLIKNMDDTLVNGSLGKVVAFMDDKTFAIKVQNAVNPEMLYESSGDVSEHEDGSGSSSKAAESKFEKYNAPKRVVGPNTSKLWPLVQFPMPPDQYGVVNSRQVLIQPEDWKVELPNGEIQAQRNQIPLILAWALSIHKAQGQTLERVKVDLKKVFENGQAYVALSRATTQEGLQVRNFNVKAVMAHPKVAKFYDNLYDVNKALKHPKVQAKREPISPDEEDDFPRDDLFDEDEEAAMAGYG